MSTAHGVARLFARRRGAGERLNARQVEQKTCSAKHMQIISESKRIMINLNSLYNLRIIPDNVGVGTGTTLV